ncbi:7892_t:CDS:1 [Cetraspora pellucida]|uniref:7892_t:CDS:1 n=1 Tax=Cetraspora pellucida TaxID=1433469 RepID=A0ACA9MJE5_9GLOM|nr:7892_t:CDS:1 [Cetraspora pellucida]
MSSIKNFKVKTTKLLKKRNLGLSYQDKDYPIDRIPFYLYGTENQLHIDHLLLKSPSIQLSAENVQIEFTSGQLTREQKERGVIVHMIAKEEMDGSIIDLCEVAMQPFPDTKYLGNSFFFKTNSQFHIELYEDPAFEPTLNGPGLDNVNYITPFATGKIILPSMSKGGLYIDSHLINADPIIEISKNRIVKCTEPWKKNRRCENDNVKTIYIREASSLAI